MKRTVLLILVIAYCFFGGIPWAFTADLTGVYAIGIDDILDISILQPDQLTTSLSVSPDGTITFPYIGNVAVKGKTLMQVQEEIQLRLAAYMKYPLVAVSLAESRSRVFYVYGEVTKPGPYPLQQNLTVLRAIAMAGGFTKYGSASKVKILRQKPDGSGNESLKVDVRAAMDGNSRQDLKIEPGDVITISEGIF